MTISDTKNQISSLAKLLPVLVGALSLGAILSACSGGNGDSGSTNGTVTPPIRVVAAENFWGSIASQLGGAKVDVRAIITSPDTDPHDYEATAGDARLLAGANYVIFNGVGYDPWVDKALDANPASGRLKLKVQSVLGLKNDDNPHRWYSPKDVQKIIDQITSDYKKLDPADAAYFDAQKSTFLNSSLKAYLDLVQEIKQKYADTPVGATESIVSPLTDALGLKMLTPSGFLTAISEGTDPTAKDKATFDSQIKNKQVKVVLFNSQNSTPDVRQLVDAAGGQGIEVVEVTETLDPPAATFQAWQVAQLENLAAALAKATGR
ncbi:MAG TPA: zinc ABC transporter substrate-binding protein [Dehalococcoidia bacterium]|nr:zinc ABC transporter substrate-binding protein [Dehalococcoidia bacterium]